MKYVIMLIFVAHPLPYPLCFVKLEQKPEDPQWKDDKLFSGLSYRCHYTSPYSSIQCVTTVETLSCLRVDQHRLMHGSYTET
jgi:hypothetical protein